MKGLAIMLGLACIGLLVSYYIQDNINVMLGYTIGILWLLGSTAIGLDYMTRHLK